MMTDSERHTLSSRISKYMRQCNERREQEVAKDELNQRLGGSVCMACNDNGEVRKRVWNPQRKKWVYAEGMMACHHCVGAGDAK